MNGRKGDLHILVSIRDNQFNLLEEFSCSGDNALVDVIYHLDEKYNIHPWKFIKRFL